VYTKIALVAEPGQCARTLTDSGTSTGERPNAGELRAIAIETTRMRFYRVSRQALRDFIDHAEAAAGISRTRPVPGLVDVPERNY
jgi:hypothetical protein